MRRLRISFVDEKRPKIKYKRYPRIEVEKIAFASDEDAEALQIAHIKKIKRKAIGYALIPISIIAVLFLVTAIAVSYNIGYDDGYDWGRELGCSSGCFDTKATAGSNERVITIPPPSPKNSLITKEDITDALKEYKEATEETCSIPGCNNIARSGSFYCSHHECLEVGCHERKANDYCHYCALHKCAVTSCNNGRASNSAYCYSHKK